MRRNKDLENADKRYWVPFISFNEINYIKDSFIKIYFIPTGRYRHLDRGGKISQIFYKILFQKI